MNNQIGIDFYFRIYFNNTDDTLMDIDNAVNVYVQAYDALTNTLLVKFSKNTKTGYNTLTRESAYYYSQNIEKSITKDLEGKSIRFEVLGIFPDATISDNKRRVIGKFTSSIFEENEINEEA